MRLFVVSILCIPVLDAVRILDHFGILYALQWFRCDKRKLAGIELQLPSLATSLNKEL